MTLKLESTAFAEGAPIPRIYTCDGKDVSPPLSWTGAPKGTSSFALICDDPDASKTWVHWVIFDLPPSTTGLPQGVAPQDRSVGGVQGTNDFRKIGYGGPCPPSGTHRYFFKLYALDTSLGLHPGATKAQLEAAIQGHIVATAQLVGMYARKR